MEKDDVRWALHWPRGDVPDEVLSQYPDLQKVDRQIKQVTDSITLEGNIATMQGISFDVRDFPMNDRIAQREFARASGLTFESIEDVQIGKKKWEVFRASEMVVIGVFRRLQGVLSADHNPYNYSGCRGLKEGDIVLYEGREVTVARHMGAHLMKYYRVGEMWKPIFPSKFTGLIQQESDKKDEVGFEFIEDQLVMTF